MATKTRTTELLDGIHQTGDADGSLKTELHKKYGPALKEQIRKDLRRYPALRGKVDATDIYQSVIARLRQATTFQPAESGTAVFRAKGRKRIRHHNRRVLSQKRDQRREDSSENARAGLTGRSASPVSAAIDQEQLLAANRLYESMTADDRQLLALREGRELSFARIGEGLGISPDAARKRCAAARKRLLAKLAAGNDSA